MDRTAAVRSRLYATPRAKVKCKLPPIRTGDWASMKRYMGTFSNCLDRIWAREFQQSRIYFSLPKRKFIRHRTKDSECGLMPIKEADGTYCDATRTYYVLVERDDLQPAREAWVAEILAHEYGHHVQNMANISSYAWEVTESARTRNAKDLLSRRLELQAECFSGVALNAMRDVMPPWWRFRYYYEGTLPERWVRDHGRLGTQLRWLERGFHSGRAGACDTWSPPKRDVT